MYFKFACFVFANIFRDKRTDAAFVWPPPELVDASRQCGCNLTTIGFLPPVKGDLLRIPAYHNVSL